MAKKSETSGLKQRFFGLFIFAGGVASEYRFIQAYLHGGSFGVISTAFAPAAIVGGMVLLVKPELYGSATTIAYDGSDLGDTRTWMIIIAVAVIGMAINAWFYFHPNS